MRDSLACVVIVAFVLMPAWNSDSRADTLIDTNPPNATITQWGPSATLQYGQVVTVPVTDFLLRSFSFTFNADSVFTFKADVAAWSGSAATGPILFSSSQSTTNVGFDQTYTINTAGLALTPNQKYVLFFDAFGGGAGHAIMAGRTDDPYGGGAFVYSNNVTANLTTGPWSLIGGNVDAAFKADFASPVPVPTSVVGGAVLLGMVAVAGITRRKRGTI